MLQYIPFIGDMVKTFFGSKEKRDKYEANRNTSIHEQFANEFGNSNNWFDSLIDGVNRLPRPVFAFGTIYLFFLCWSEPDKFVEGAKNLELMPDQAWWILGTIVVFFFGGRLSRDFGKYKIKDNVLKKYQDKITNNSNINEKKEKTALEKSMDIAKKRSQFND